MDRMATPLPAALLLLRDVTADVMCSSVAILLTYLVDYSLSATYIFNVHHSLT
jgi:hypothetical protein